MAQVGTHPADVVEFVNRANLDRDPLAYHRIDFGGGLVLDGEGDAGEYWVTWIPDKAALIGMLIKAGFEGVHYVGDFHLKSAPGHNDYDTLHGVVHGFTPG